MSPEILAAGADLMFIRGLVCKTLREGADATEIAALLVAEEAAAKRLAELQGVPQ